MKLSLQTILLILFMVNLFLAGMGIMESMIRSSEESERMTHIPADWRYRAPHSLQPHEPNDKTAGPSQKAVVDSQSKAF